MTSNLKHLDKGNDNNRLMIKPHTAFLYTCFFLGYAALTAIYENIMNGQGLFCKKSMNNSHNITQKIFDPVVLLYN